MGIKPHLNQVSLDDAEDVVRIRTGERRKDVL